MELDSKTTGRRKFFRGATEVALASAIAVVAPMLAACDDPEQKAGSPPPVDLRGKGEATKTAALSPDKPYFDSRFSAVIAKGKELAALFPQLFAGADRFTETLNRLVQDYEIDAELMDSEALGSVQEILYKHDQQGTVINFTVRVSVGGDFFNKLPEEQVMIMLHELGHQKDIKELLRKYIGKNADQLSKAIDELEANHISREAKEIFKNCQQLEALKTRNRDFKTNKPVPFEVPVPALGSRSLYDSYLTYKNSPNGYQDPRWTHIITIFLEAAHNEATILKDQANQKR